jgi:hypothetical protein
MNKAVLEIVTDLLFLIVFIISLPPCVSICRLPNRNRLLGAIYGFILLMEQISGWIYDWEEILAFIWDMNPPFGEIQ